MAENENQNAPETEKTNTEENNEKINKEIPKEENSEQKTEENKPEIKEEETKKEEKLNQENNNKEEGKKDNEDENEDDSQKKLINSIKELPSESIKAKSIILYDLNEDMKSQYLDKYKSERTAIELKELDNFLNYFNKIRDIINSSSDKKESIISLISDQNKEKYSIKEENGEDKSEFEPIKNFWLTSLINAKFFEFNENDKKILEHLIDIKYIPLTFPSFKIEFIFDENEYLEENVIYKTYYFHENDKDFMEKTEGCEIKWKDADKNPTMKTIIKHKKKKKEYITKNVKSFFNIFDTKDKDNLDKELVEANFFRNDFLENMLEYYLNIMEFKFNEEEDDD